MMKRVPFDRNVFFLYPCCSEPSSFRSVLKRCEMIDVLDATIPLDWQIVRKLERTRVRPLRTLSTARARRFRCMAEGTEVYFQDSKISGYLWAIPFVLSSFLPE